MNQLNQYQFQVSRSRCKRADLSTNICQLPWFSQTGCPPSACWSANVLLRVLLFRPMTTSSTVLERKRPGHLTLANNALENPRSRSRRPVCRPLDADRGARAKSGHWAESQQNMKSKPLMDLSSALWRGCRFAPSGHRVVPLGTVAKLVNMGISEMGVPPVIIHF